jgi:transposase
MRLNSDQFTVLVVELKKGAAAHGWPNELWTGERAATLIERLFHIRYTPDHVRVLLRERLSWTSQKPEKRGRERDEKEIERWRKEEYPRIKKRQATRRPSRLPR